MRHLKRTAKLGRTGTHRNRMLANMVCSLIKHRRITTTLAKAKAARSVAEKMITLGKTGTLHARRLAASRLHQDEEKTKMKKLLNMSVNEIELSVRAANCLNNANITSVGQLSMKTEAEMLKYRNFGKKSLNEIKEKLASLGLSLGMNIDQSLLEAPKEEPKPAE